MSTLRALAAIALAIPMLMLGVPLSDAQQAASPMGPDIGTFYQDEDAPLYKARLFALCRPEFPTRVLWGDTHLHTANSLDAAAFGNTLGPEEAYRFARGEEVISSSGQPVKLSRPLDFLVVADHAEGLGATIEMKKGNPLLMADPTLKRWHDMMAGGGRAGRGAFEIIRSVGTGTTPAEALFSPPAREDLSGRPTRPPPNDTTSRAVSPP